MLVEVKEPLPVVLRVDGPAGCRLAEGCGGRCSEATSLRSECGCRCWCSEATRGSERRGRGRGAEATGSRGSEAASSRCAERRRGRG